MIIAGIIKQENSSTRINRIVQVNDRSRISSLKTIRIHDGFQFCPGFSMVTAFFHDNIDIPEVTTSVYTAFTKCQQIAIGYFYDSGYPVAFMSFSAGSKYRNFFLCRCGKNTEKAQGVKQYYLFHSTLILKVEAGNPAEFIRLASVKGFQP